MTVAVGDAAELELLLSHRLVRRYSYLSGDRNPIHIDADYAAQTRFGRPIAHGMLIGAYISALIANELPGPGSIYLGQSLTFIRPAYVGEVIKIRVSVVGVNRDNGVIHLECQAANTALESIVEGTAVVLAP